MSDHPSRHPSNRRRTRRPLLAAVLLLGFASSCEKLPNVPPTASFVYSPVSPIYAGQTTVVFNASGSRDSDGSISMYVWNFGDRTPEQAADTPVTAHVFPDTAERCLEVIYTVLLTVVDNGNERGSASQQVRVVELPAPTSEECTRR